MKKSEFSESQIIKNITEGERRKAVMCRNISVSCYPGLPNILSKKTFGSFVALDKVTEINPTSSRTRQLPQCGSCVEIDLQTIV